MLALHEHPDDLDDVEDALLVARTLRELPFDVNLWQAQNLWYDTFRAHRDNPPSTEWLEKMNELGSQLHIAVDAIVAEEPNGNGAHHESGSDCRGIRARTSLSLGLASFATAYWLPATGFLSASPPQSTGPSIGCFIASPVRSASSRACFSAKYHFAGLSASSISISAGSNFNPSACWIIVT